MIKMHHDYREELQELKRLARLHNYPCTEKLVREFSREQLIEYLTKNNWRVQHLECWDLVSKELEDDEVVYLIPFDDIENRDRYFKKVCELINYLSTDYLKISVIELVYYIKQIKIAYVG
jgi:hypothetical protein